MRLRCTWIIILCICLPALVAAQSYQYNDESGVLQVTDNSAEVPANQRTGDLTKTDNIIPKGPQAEGLLNIKAELDQEYSELVKEGDAINSMAGMPLSKEDFEAYTERENRFNERRIEYEKRVGEFQQQVDTFNQQQAVAEEAFVKTEKQKAAVTDGLVKTKAELDKEYADLMKEREAIVAEGSDPNVFATTETFEAYQQKVADFNERKADYERRAKEYQEKAEAYNKSLK